MAHMTLTETDEPVEALATRQMQRFTRAQVRCLGDDAARLIDSRVRSGRWRRLTRRVLCLPGAPTDWLGDVWTAHLHVGADSVVSHRTAGRIHGLPGITDGVPCLTLPAGCHRRYSDGELYQRGDLVPGQIDRVGGLPVTSVARAIVDLAPGASRPRIEAWLDHCTAERLVDPAEIRLVIEARSIWGKNSIQGLEDVLADYLPGEGVVQGRLERALDLVLRIAGLPRGLPQFGHPGVDSPEEFCDRAWLQPRLIVECDGRRWHDRRRGARVDKRRDASAAAEGWQTIRYCYEELVQQPEECAGQLRTIYEQRMIEHLDSSLAEPA